MRSIHLRIRMTKKYLSNSFTDQYPAIPLKFSGEETVSGLVQHVNIDSVPGLNLPEYDYISATYPLTTQEVYVYKTGGSGGATVATVTVNYVDATKEAILNVTKT